MYKQREKVLIVDDNPEVIRAHEEILKPEGYSILQACNGAEALALVERESPDLILLDVSMPPGIDGYGVATRIKEDPITKSIPIIMMGDTDESHSRLIGLNAGAEEFLIKPVECLELRVRIKNLLRFKAYADNLDRHNHMLNRKVYSRTAELHKSHLETIFALTRAAEHRDDDTGAHVRRISRYSRHLADTLGLENSYGEMIQHASPMHDLGKIGIPDNILLKPAAHTDTERTIMMSHTTLGADILIGCESPYLKMGAEIALNHHECWDGGGYPNGLAGESIPLPARITAICDVYDALRSKRHYKAAFSHEEAMHIITQGDGRTQPDHFDPAVLNSFKRNAHHFNEIFYDECE